MLAPLLLFYDSGLITRDASLISPMGCLFRLSLFWNDRIRPSKIFLLCHISFQSCLWIWCSYFYNSLKQLENVSSSLLPLSIVYVEQLNFAIILHIKFENTFWIDSCKSRYLFIFKSDVNDQSAGLQCTKRYLKYTFFDVLTGKTIAHRTGVYIDTCIM